MKKIGQGWQYTVYDIGNGRIRKVFNTKTQAYVKFFCECFPYTDFPVWGFSKLREELQTKAEVSIAWIRNSQLHLSLFGNPKILNKTDYEQDLVIPLEQYLKTVSFENGKSVIDEFINLNKFFIRNDVIDKSFLIGKNYGIDHEQKIILIDIGELFIGKEKIENQIKLQPWDHPYVTNTLPKQLRLYFVDAMNKNLL
jgi:hypothetical protein